MKVRLGDLPYINGGRTGCPFALTFLVFAASAIPFSDNYPKPKELTAEGITRILDAFEAAAKRAKTAGCEFAPNPLSNSSTTNPF